MLTTADVAAGEAKTAVCQSCHNFDAAGTNSIGPGLYGVVGRKPGSHPGFAYSPAMEAVGGQAADLGLRAPLRLHLTGPQAYVAGTKMTFVGISNPGPHQRHRLSAHPGLEPADPAPSPKGRRSRGSRGGRRGSGHRRQHDGPGGRRRQTRRGRPGVAHRIRSGDSRPGRVAAAGHAGEEGLS